MTITYVYRGQVERGCLVNGRHGRPSYRWHDGYSQETEQGPLYPWLTRAECLKDAKSQGCKALFYTPPGPGEKRFEPEVL